MPNLEHRSKLLFISGNPSETESLTEKLRRTYIVDMATNCGEALDRLRGGNYDLVVVRSGSLKGMATDAFCRAAYGNPLYREIPQVVVSDRPQKSTDFPLYKTWLMSLKDESGATVFTEDNILEVVDAMIKSCPVVR